MITASSVFLVFAGGACGSSLRYAFIVHTPALVAAVNRRMQSHAPTAALPMAFPYSTLLVNLLGSFLIGLLTQFILIYSLPDSVGYLLITGFLGGLTTFSSYIIDTWGLMRKPRDIVSTEFISNQADTNTRLSVEEEIRGQEEHIKAADSGRERGDNERNDKDAPSTELTNIVADPLPNDNITVNNNRPNNSSSSGGPTKAGPSSSSPAIVPSMSNRADYAFHRYGLYNMLLQNGGCLLFCYFGLAAAKGFQTTNIEK